MHRVRLRAEVDHPPADRLPELVAESLGRRPRQAVDHEREPRLEPDEHFGRQIGGDDLLQLARREVSPFGDHQDPVRFDRALRRVDDERPRQLAERDGRAHRRCPVMVGSGRTAPESHLAGLAGRHLQRRARRAVARAEAPDHQRRLPIVANRHDELGAFHHAYQRRWNGERLTDFSEGLDFERRAGRPFGLPAAGAGPQRERHGSAIEAARRPQVVVGLDGGKRRVRG
jgi:hypothetical protein